jgi:hypothetical protein
MDKGQLLDYVRQWMKLDDEIKEYGKLMKNKRQEKKDITALLLNTMKENEIDCFNLDGGNKLVYQKSKIKKCLSKKHLIDALSRYLKDTDKAKELGEFILDSREEQLKENIKRKTSK